MELCFGHAGNGMSIWRKGQNGYLAHISPEREVTFKGDAQLLFTQEEINEIYKVSQEDDGGVSTTQPDTYIFNEPPIFIGLDSEIRGVVTESLKTAKYRGYDYVWLSIKGHRPGWRRKDVLDETLMLNNDE